MFAFASNTIVQSPWIELTVPHTIIDDPSEALERVQPLIEEIKSGGAYDYPILPIHSVPLNVFLNPTGAPPEVCSPRLLDEMEGATRWTMDTILDTVERCNNKTPSKFLEGFSFGYAGDCFFYGKVWAFDERDICVGGIAHGNIWVHPDQRGKGISSEMILIAFERGISRLHEHRFYSPAGLLSHISAYKKSLARSKNT